MLDQICGHIHNYFTADEDIHAGTFTIAGGEIDLSEFLLDGQYFRIVGSVFNDGVYKYPPSLKDDETFTGEIWAMKVPRALIDLDGEIEDWVDKYGAITSSPYQSESVIGVYSRSKAAGGTAGASGPTWQSTFAARLNEWRKLR